MFGDPLGRPGPGVHGFGGAAGVLTVSRAARNPRRTRAGVIVPGGWGLIRASNTQPILVLRWEAQSKEKMAELQRLIEGTVDEVRRELQA